eukprot:3945101-Amphidinium_carterae.1
MPLDELRNIRGNFAVAHRLASKNTGASTEDRRNRKSWQRLARQAMSEALAEGHFALQSRTQCSPQASESQRPLARE